MHLQYVWCIRYCVLVVSKPSLWAQMCRRKIQSHLKEVGEGNTWDMCSVTRLQLTCSAYMLTQGVALMKDIPCFLFCQQYKYLMAWPFIRQLKRLNREPGIVNKPKIQHQHCNLNNMLFFIVSPWAGKVVLYDRSWFFFLACCICQLTGLS